MKIEDIEDVTTYNLDDLDRMLNQEIIIKILEKENALTHNIRKLTDNQEYEQMILTEINNLSKELKLLKEALYVGS